MRHFSAKDIYLHRTLTSLTAGTQHRRLVFQVGRALRHADSYQRTLWSLESNDASARRFTTKLFTASSPMWSPAGERLAFVSKRQQRGTQVYLLDMHGGEAKQLTHAKDQTPSSIEGWSPDGDALLVLAKTDWQEDGEEPAPDGAPKGSRSPQVARYLPYKQDGAGITVTERDHLYRVDVATGRLDALTSGDYDVSLAAWSPNGRQVAYVRNRTARQRHRQDLWTCGDDGDEAHLVLDELASISAVAWSPYDHSIAVVGSRDEGDSRSGLWLVDARSGALRQLGGMEFAVEAAGKVHWHPDGRRLLVVTSHRGLQQIAVVDPDTDQVERWPMGLKHVTAVAPWGERIALVAASMRKPEEIYSVDLQGGDLKRHTNFNSRWFGRRARPRVVKRRFEVPDGNGGREHIDAWVLTPAGAKPPYPLLVDMHGGPHSAVLVDYAAHTYWYELCSKGWAIVAPNAVGSLGYGQEFSERLRGRWGELDLPQFQAVVRQLQQEGVAGDRVACTGKSYGGFLSAWAVAHSESFRAAIVCAPVSNILSHFGTSDSGYYVTPFAMAGEYPEHRQRYEQLSPVTHCHKVKAPVMILQGENDGRCPRGQAEELFAHLIRYTDVPAELVIYPDSSHAEAESGRPANRVDYHSRIASWACRWTG